MMRKQGSYFSMLSFSTNCFRESAYSRLGELYRNFVDTAVLYGKIIISEQYLPQDMRTIQPAHLGGFAGGTKYVVQNIIFKFAEQTDLFEDLHSAQKLSSHELKGSLHKYHL